jgi:hypothetical protein
MQVNLFRRLIHWQKPTVYDWQTASRKVDYQRTKAWQIWLMLMFMASMSVVSLIGMFMVFRDSAWISWSNGLIGTSLLVVGTVWYFVWDEGVDDELPLMTLAGPIYALYIAVKQKIFRYLDRYILILSAFFLFIPVNAFFTNVTIRRYYPLPLWQLVACCLIVVSLAATLMFRNESKKRASRNPLRSLLDGSSGKPFFSHASGLKL